MSTETHKKKKLSCEVEPEFLEKVKNAVVFLQTGPAPQTSLRSFIQGACQNELEAVKRRYRRLLPKSGKIPKRKKVQPRPGRPME